MYEQKFFKVKRFIINYRKDVISMVLYIKKKSRMILHLQQLKVKLTKHHILHKSLKLWAFNVKKCPKHNLQES